MIVRYAKTADAAPLESILIKSKNYKMQAASCLRTGETPSELTCPLSQDLYRYPVRVEDDAHRIYDFRTISRWLQTNPSDPFTRLPLRGKYLVPQLDVFAQTLKFRRAVAAAHHFAGNVEESAARIIQAAWWQYAASAMPVPLKMDIDENNSTAMARAKATVSSRSAVSRAAIARSQAFSVRRKIVPRSCTGNAVSLNNSDGFLHQTLRALTYGPHATNTDAHDVELWRKWQDAVRRDGFYVEQALTQPLGEGCELACSPLDVLLQSGRYAVIGFLATKLKPGIYAGGKLAVGQRYGRLAGYTGQWSNNRPWGYGLAQTRRNSWWSKRADTYHGYWSDGYPSGQGTCFYSDGSVYRGEWVQGKRDGHGVFTDVSRQYNYQGGWRNNIQNGLGIEVMADEAYSGDFSAGLRHGGGVHTRSNGNVYEGFWENGHRHGSGRLTFGSGGYFEGMWQHDRLTQFGTMT